MQIKQLALEIVQLKAHHIKDIKSFKARHLHEISALQQQLKNIEQLQSRYFNKKQMQHLLMSPL